MVTESEKEAILHEENVRRGKLGGTARFLKYGKAGMRAMINKRWGNPAQKVGNRYKGTNEN